MDKFKALVHLVIQGCDDPRKLGATRLNKILWFADREAYLATGNSISGTTYVRRPRGPVPKHILKSLRELEQENKISIQEPSGQYMPREFTSLEAPNSEMFSDVEKSIVDNISQVICDQYTADEISERSHDISWEAAADGEEIPLSSTLASCPGDYRPTVTNWADEVVAAVRG